MIFKLYILVDRKVTPIEDPGAWSMWMFGPSTADHRTVAKSLFNNAEVSTIFLGQNHCCRFGEKAPVLWETMVFGGKLNMLVRRCAGTWEQAEAQHAEVLAMVKALT